MPVSLRKGSLVVSFLLFFSVSLFSQTIYFSYDEDMKDSAPIFETPEYRKERIKELILLDLPFLLNTCSLEEVSVPEGKEKEWDKLLRSRIVVKHDASQEKSEPTNDSGNEGGVLPSSAENQQLPEQENLSSSDESPVVTQIPEVGENIPERNAAPADPLFSFFGIDGATDRDSFVYIKMKKADLRMLSDQRLFAEIVFDFYLAYDNRVEIFCSEIRSVGLAEDESAVIREVTHMQHVSFKSILNSIFGKAGTPYIVNFINTKKVVIAQGRRQGAFPGAFYCIFRHEINKNGEIRERVIGRLYVEKCEEDYSFCRILYASERIVPGDGIRKIPGIGVHQSFGYGLLISSLPVTDTESAFYVNHLVSARWVVNREMPIAKPAFGFEILMGSDAQLDPVGMMKAPVIGNIYAGIHVDRFFHQFSFSPFIDLGFAFTANIAQNKPALTWFTCKAGARFLWMFHDQIGVYLEGGYISWLGIPGKESVFEDSQYIYYAPNDYTGGFGGVGFTFLY